MYILGKYEILRELGRGGMGIVYKARDTRLGRIVALKELMIPQIIIGKERENLIERFHREAQAAANLSHPAIITVYDVGEENDHHYIAMEFLEGKSLKDYIASKTVLPFFVLIELFIKVCNALDLAHSKGVIHRDIKPDNIMITKEGGIKITDFGVARMSQGLSSMTSDGTMLGTLGYMSPEQLADARMVDGRADIFSIGAVLYELYTQVSPFAGETVGSTILKILTQEPIPPRKLNPNIPPELEQIILKALHKNPVFRYQTAKEVVLDLEKLIKKDEKQKILCSNCQCPLDTNIRFCPNCGTPVTTRQSVKPKEYITPVEPKPQELLNSLFGRERNIPQEIQPEPESVPEPKTEPPVSKQKQLEQMFSSMKSFDAIKSAVTSPGEKKDPYSQMFQTSQKKEEQITPPASISTPNKTPQEVPTEVMEYYSQYRVLFQRIIGKPGSGKGQFSSPKSLALASNGMIYVLAPQNQKIQVFDRLGDWQFLVPLNEGKEAMRSPVSIAVDNQRRIYVLDSLESKVKILDNSGRFITEFGDKGQGRAQFSVPANIAVSNSMQIYVADTDNYRIQVFDSSGQVIKILGKYGSKNGEFKSPCSVAIDETERVYCLDYGIPRIQVIDKNGITRLVFGRRGIGNGEFSVPKGITIDKKKRIYVADTLNHRVQIFDDRGYFITTFGSKGNGEGQFIGPEAIAVSNEGEIFVLDKGNNRIQVFKALNF